jgi:hypothetical protein
MIEEMRIRIGNDEIPELLNDIQNELNQAKDRGQALEIATGEDDDKTDEKTPEPELKAPVLEIA